MFLFTEYRSADSEIFNYIFEHVILNTEKHHILAHFKFYLSENRFH